MNGAAGTMIEGLVAIALAFALAFIPAVIAQGKGRSFGLWWLYGFLLFVVALVHALLLKPTGAVEFKGKKACPECAEPVRREAMVCRFCGFRFSDAASADAGFVLPLERMQRRKAGSKAWLIALGIVAVIGVGFGWVWFFHIQLFPARSPIAADGTAKPNAITGKSPTDDFATGDVIIDKKVHESGAEDDPPFNITFKPGQKCWKYEGTGYYFRSKFVAGEVIYIKAPGLLYEDHGTDHKSYWEDRDPSINIENGPTLSETDGLYTIPTSGTYDIFMWPHASQGLPGKVAMCRALPGEYGASPTPNVGSGGG